MPVINQGWYDANGAIAYPIDDRATALADDGSRLPSNIVVDLNLRWPETLGQYAFVSGVSVTTSAVTVVILAADAPTSASQFLPLATVTIPQPVEEDRVYSLSAQDDGVSGWIVFGEGVRQAYTGRFSTPEQTRIAPRAGRSYLAWPVESIQVAGTSLPLTGIVTLKVQPPLVATMEEREIAGALRDCIVISLTGDSQTQGITAAQVPSPDDNIFRRFAGPCGGRPESGTCGNPQPVEFINSVGPDCEGVITLDFSGCATVGQILGRCGATLECDLGLSGACLPPRLPDADGNLPSDLPPVDVPPEEPEEPTPGPVSISESFSDITGLPYVDCFSDLVANDFNVIFGRWDFVNDDSPDNFCPDEVAFAASLSTSTPSDIDVLEGLAARWELDEESGDRLDTSGNGHTLKQRGTVGAEVGVNGQGRAALFTAGGGCLETTGPIVTSGAFSLSIWFRIDDNDTNDLTLWAQQGVTLGSLQWIGYSNDNAEIQASSDGITVVTFPITLGVRYHAVLTNDGTTQRLYVNGSLVSSGPCVPNYTQIYRSVINLCGSSWTGSADQTYMYSRALPGGDVERLFNHGDARNFPTSFGGSASYSAIRASYASTTAGARNISVWNAFDHHPTFRRWQTDLKMNPGPSGTKHNGGFVLNFHNSIYHVAEIDYDTQAIRLLRFDGATFQIVATAPMPGVTLSQWHRLIVTAVPGNPGQTIITIEAFNLNVSTVQATLMVTTTQYVPSIGLVGFHANRALTYFSHFKVEVYEG